MVHDDVVVRPARVGDAAAIAALLLEGFGHEYGTNLRTPEGRRMMERIHKLPGRLTGIFVVSIAGGPPVAMAGFRTREIRSSPGWMEEQITIEEIGFRTALLLELRASLSEPGSYQPQADEAYLYNVVVTTAWRGKGISDHLLGFLHHEAERRGKRRVLLEVVASNHAARRLYERLGYRIIRTRRGLLSLLRLGVPPRLLMAKTLG